MAIGALALTPLNDTAVSLALNTTVGITNPLGKSSTIDIFEVWLEADAADGAGTPLGHLVTGTAKVKEGYKVVVDVNTSANMSIQEAGWVSFVDRLINTGGDLKMHMAGIASAEANIQALKENLTVAALVNVTVATAGMGGLKDIDILNFTATGDQTTTHIECWTTINNPSVTSAHMGDATVNFSYSGAYVGTMGAKDLSVAPGLNYVKMTGVIDPHKGDLTKIGEFFSEYITGKDTTVAIQGVGAAAGAAPWLQKAVQAIHTTTVFKGYTAPDTLLGKLEILEMGMSLASDGTPMMAGRVNATMRLPTSMAMPMGVTCAAMGFNMSDAEGHVMAALNIACPDNQATYTPQPCTKDHCGGHLLVTFTATLMDVKDWARLSAFLGQALRQPTVSASMKGTASPLMTTSFAPEGFVLNGIPFESTVSIAGMDGFKNAVKIGTIDIIDGEADKLDMATSAIMTNPSIVNTALGAVSFDLVVNATTNNITVGQASIAAFNLGVGAPSVLNATVKYTTTPDPQDGLRFLSDYLCQRDQVVTFRNAQALGNNARLLQPAMNGFEMSSTLPGRSKNLMTAGVMSWNDAIVPLLVNIPVVLNVSNPYSTKVSITGAHETITYTDSSGKSAAMGVYTYCKWPEKTDCSDNLQLNPIVLPPNLGNGVTPSHNVKTALLTLESLEALGNLVCGGSLTHCHPKPIDITIGGTMDIAVGGFTATVNVTEAFPVWFTGLPIHANATVDGQASGGSELV